jgi:hypothetical protein
VYPNCSKFFKRFLIKIPTKKMKIEKNQIDFQPLNV